MKITYADLMVLDNAYSYMRGSNTAFNGLVALSTVRNSRLVMQELNNLRDAQIALAETHKIGQNEQGGYDSSSPEYPKYEEEFKKIAQEEVELDLRPMRAEHLENAVLPIWVVGVLDALGLIT